MANTIQIRRGGGTPTGNGVAGEPGFDTTAKKLFVSDGAAQFGVVMDALYDAGTFLYATDDNTPAVKTRVEVMALLSGQNGADFDMGTKKITGVDTPTLGGDAVNKTYADGLVGGAGAVLKSDYDATTFMYALADDLPLPKTPAEVKAILDLEIGTDVLAQQTIGIGDDNLVEIDGADIATGEYARFTAAGLQSLTDAEVMADLSGAAGADFAMGNNKITGLTDPSGAQDAATKASSEAYADAVASGLDLKNSVVTATTAVLPACTPAGSGVGKTLTGDVFGLLTVDGQAVVETERILVKNQAAGEDNGIYTVTTIGAADAYFVLTRATDADQDAEVTAGMYCFIEEGTANADEGWVLTTDDAITVDTTALAFSQFSSATFVDTFLELTDSPSDYTDDADKIVVVNSGADGVTFTNVMDGGTY